MDTKSVILCIIGAVIAYVFRLKFSSIVNNNLKTQDTKLATDQSNVESELVDIKKQLAEKKTGLTNMTPEAVEDYWKKN